TRTWRPTASAKAITARSSSAREGKEGATHIVVVGNVVEDQAPGGGWVPGGPSLYIARTALALGAEATLVTTLAPGYDRSVLEGLAARAIPAASAPRYANTYSAEGQRTQLLFAPGEPIPVDAAGGAGPCDGLIVAPAYHE